MKRIAGHRSILLVIVGLVLLTSLLSHLPAAECRPIRRRILPRISNGLHTFALTLSNRFTSLFESDPSSVMREDFSSCGHGGCGPYDFNKIVPGFTLVSVSYFLVYLLNDLVGKRRRRSLTPSNNYIGDEQNLQGKDIIIFMTTLRSLV